MHVLSPIDVEFYEAQFKKLSEKLLMASNLLLPDAYQMEKDQLLSAKEIVDSHTSGFNEVLNQCSAGVLFNESLLPISAETNSSLSVTNLLWSCQDIISSVLLLNEDLSEYIKNLTITDELVWKLDQFVLTEKKFNAIADDLLECSRLITSVLTKFNDYNI